MKVLVNLNNKVDVFQIKDEHRKRFTEEFPQHEFHFCDSYEDFKEKIEWAEFGVVWFFPEKLFQSAVNLKKLFTPSAGKDWVAIDSTGKAKTYFSSYHGHMIVESFLAMLLYHNNGLAHAVKNQSKNLWDRNAFGQRSLLKNKSVLIIGHGNIGEICAGQLKSLGVRVTGACRNLEKQSCCELRPLSNLNEYIGQYDIILDLLPGGDDTRGFISEKLIGQMKKGVLFFNFGRGSTVDQNALIKYLKSGHIEFAGLDVFDEEPLDENSELWSLPNALLTPHTSCCYTDYLHLFIDELRIKMQ